MPFPLRTEIICQCYVHDLYELDIGDLGPFWLNVIAKRNGTGLIEFFGLTGINDVLVQNPLLPSLGRELTIILPLDGFVGTTFKFIGIPTRNINPDPSVELLKYLSSTNDVIWTLLDFDDILVLKLVSPSNFFESPVATFTFPVFSSPEQIRIIRDLVDKKHECVFESCKTFYFCPNNPIGSPDYDRNHLHCTTPHVDCPRRYDRIVLS